MAAAAAVEVSARSPRMCRSSRFANALGRSCSMNFNVPRQVSRATFRKMPGGSLTLSRAAWTTRGTCRSFDTTRRARSDTGVDGAAAQVLEKIVMEMHPIQAGLAWLHLVQVREVVVDEMRKWLRWVHARRFQW